MCLRSGVGSNDSKGGAQSVGQPDFSSADGETAPTPPNVAPGRFSFFAVAQLRVGSFRSAWRGRFRTLAIWREGLLSEACAGGAGMADRADSERRDTRSSKTFRNGHRSAAAPSRLRASSYLVAQPMPARRLDHPSRRRHRKFSRFETFFRDAKRRSEPTCPYRCLLGELICHFTVISPLRSSRSSKSSRFVSPGQRQQYRASCHRSDRRPPDPRSPCRHHR